VNQKIDLTTGKITLQLTRVALPIMMTMFIQMAYVLTDMYWIGWLGSGALAAIGSAGFFTWLGISVAFLAKTGLEVVVAQSAGKNDATAIKCYIRNGVILTVLIAIAYSLLILVFTPQLIGFFNLGTDVDSYNPTANAIIYLKILAVGMIFTHLNLSFSAIYNGLGKSKLPFYFNSIGLIINIILDPLLIYGIGPFPRLEVPGAAMATIFAHGVVFTLFVIKLKRDFKSVSLRSSFTTRIGTVISKPHFFKIIKIGFPPSFQGAIFATIGIVIARIISQWGPIGIAVQRVGAQIEAISWMTASGFSIALTAFVGQNFGAGKIKRIWQGFLTAISIMTCIGIFATFLLLLLPEQLFRIFAHDPETIKQGIIYLTILSYSQLFMCLEMTTAGAFNGLGKTIPPSVISISFNLLRIPAAVVLSGMMGLSGIWWSICGSSILKGVILLAWFVIYFRIKYKKIYFCLDTE
jgi:putative MATE family efflux protein